MSDAKDEKGFKCHLCPKSYVTERGYKKHLSVHSGATTSDDSQTDTVTSTGSGLTSKRRTTEPAGNDNVVTCEVCDKTYKTEAGVAKHFKTHAQGLNDTPDLTSEVRSQTSGENSLNIHRECFDDDPDDPSYFHDKKTDIDEASYFEDPNDEEEGEENGDLSNSEEPLAKKRKKGKDKKIPLVTCSTCGRSYQTNEGFMKHRVMHAIEVVYATAPDMERLKEECPRLAEEVLKEIQDLKYSVGPSAEVAKATKVLSDNTSTAHWMYFICKACEGLSAEFLSEIKKKTPNQLRESFVRNSGIYKASSEFEELLEILSKILDTERKVKVLTCSTFLRRFSHKIFAFFIHAIMYESKNPPVCLPSKYASTKQSVDSLEFKKIMYYIGGSNVKSILRTGLRKKVRTEEWDKVLKVLKKSFIIGESAEAPDADIMTWTLAQDRGRLIKISDNAVIFFVKLARIVKPLEHGDGSLYIEEVIETVVSSPELTFLWNTIIGNDLNGTESFKLLHALCSHFCVTWSSGIVGRRHDELHNQKTSKHHGTGGVAFRATVSR